MKMASIAANRFPATDLSTQSDNTSSHPYTCNTCQVAFRNGESQRGHMRSDWHRYNLKRRVASLPPITAEVFSEKVIQAQASTTAAAAKAAYEKICTSCQKTYFSENAYQNHITSQRHKVKAAAVQKETGDKREDETGSVISSNLSLGAPVATKDGNDKMYNEVVDGLKDTSLKDEPTSTPLEIDKDENPGELPLHRCLFCNYDSPSIPLNTMHMERIHGMFIPERSYLVDSEGLIRHLQKKIQYYQECLYCGKMKSTTFGLQTHMRDTGHCKIPYETEAQQLDIGDYYDFTSTYSDADDDDELMSRGRQSYGSKLGAKRGKLVDAEGDDTMVNGDGWETDSSASSLDSADLTAVPLEQRTHQYEKLDQHPHHAHTDPRPHHNRDGWHSHAHKPIHTVFYSEYELHLPSGRSAGHRSLNRYYRQNLHNHHTPAERMQRAIEAAAETDSDEENQQLARRHQRGRAMISRANGGLGMVGVTAEKRKEAQAEERRSRKIQQRERGQFQWGNNKQSNHQKHFRDPLLQ